MRERSAGSQPGCQRKPESPSLSSEDLRKPEAQAGLTLPKVVVVLCIQGPVTPLWRIKVVPLWIFNRHIQQRKEGG